MNDGLQSRGLLEAVAHPCRRALLFAMAEPSTTVADTHDAVDLLDRPDRTGDAETVHIELYHVHLPKLAEVGVIEWDHESGELSKGPDWEAAASVLRLLDDHQDELPAWASDPRCGD